MDYDISSIMWTAVIVLLTLWVSRMVAGYLVTKESGSAQVIGQALGGIVG